MGRRNAGIERVVGVCLCQPAQLERGLGCKTVRRLEELLSSGNAVESERCKRDFEKGK